MRDELEAAVEDEQVVKMNPHRTMRDELEAVMEALSDAIRAAKADGVELREGCFVAGCIELGALELDSIPWKLDAEQASIRALGAVYHVVEGLWRYTQTPAIVVEASDKPYLLEDTDG